MTPTPPTMPFSRTAHVYDALYEPLRDYQGQARRIAAWIEERKPDATTLLDVACGTGLHLSHLRSTYRVEGVDVSPPMVEIARTRNPGVPVHLGDMRSFDLEKRFDVLLCLFSSITYSLDGDGLRRTLANFARHLHPGGLCIVEPYLPPEAWRDGVTGLRTAEEPERKVAMVDRAERTGRRVRREIAYVVATPSGLQQIFERHEFFLFSRAEYRQAFRDAGFRVDFEEVGFEKGRGMYLGTLRARG